MRELVSQVWITVLIVGLTVFLAPEVGAVSVTLKGSPESMARQNHVAKQHGLTFTETDDDVQALIDSGGLVPIQGDANYSLLPNMMYPYGQPEMRMFVMRLGAQYRAATGEKLVVTSLTRPADRQPANGHSLSVHPTGAAVDLRVSKRARSRQWLESVLLNLERQGILDVTREKYPPHYHVALFPEAYRAHVERLEGKEAVELALRVPARKEEAIQHEGDSAKSGVPGITASVVGAASSPQRMERRVPWVVLSAAALAVFPLFYHRRRRATSDVPEAE